MTGLEAQLGGMGVAFGSSLLGLAGSLVVGLLELFAGHGQNRFYQELEDWLSSITRVGLTSGDDVSDQNIMASVMDQMVEQMGEMQQMFTQSDISRTMVDDKLGKLADAVDRMTTRMEREDPTGPALTRVAEGQERLVSVLEGQIAGEGIDAESRMRLRSIDVQMLRILEEISAGRQETMAELRKDISLLAKALSGQRVPEARRLRAGETPGGGDQ